MTAFESAIKALFADLNMAKDAIYVPLQGENRPVRVVIRAPDVFANVGRSVIETPSAMLEVQVTDCPVLVPGDSFIVGAVTYTVQGEPRRDSEQLTWQADLYAA